MGASSSTFNCYCEESAFHSKYALGKMLGKGSQGRVHVCVDRKTGETRAVKIIDRSWRTAWATYRREVELCKAASASNIIAVLEEFVDAGYCYVVMEKFEGHLRKGLKWVAKEQGDAKSPLAEDSLRRVVWQTLAAINHLHCNGIVHRDVKSHNLLIDRLDLRDPSCRVVLGDFGLARRLEQGRFLCSQVGTRKYWAPELYERKYWHVVDVFAVGVLIFLATCSTYPFMDEEQTRHRDLWKEGAVPQSLGKEACEFLHLVLQKDPRQRPSASQILEHTWLTAHGHMPPVVLQQPDPTADSDPGGLERSFGPKLPSYGEVGPPPPSNLQHFSDDGPRIQATGSSFFEEVVPRSPLGATGDDSFVEQSIQNRLLSSPEEKEGFATDATPSTDAVPWSSPQGWPDEQSPVPWMLTAGEFEGGPFSPGGAEEDEEPAERLWLDGALREGQYDQEGQPAREEDLDYPLSPRTEQQIIDSWRPGVFGHAQPVFAAL